MKEQLEVTCNISYFQGENEELKESYSNKLQMTREEINKYLDVRKQVAHSLGYRIIYNTFSNKIAFERTFQGHLIMCESYIIKTTYIK